ncbi:MAG: hypothetical protein AB1665_02320 [Candidatus Thermoplasmatota archaeon]
MRIERAVAAQGEPPEVLQEVWTVAAFANALIRNRATQHLSREGERDEGSTLAKGL